MKSKKHLRKNTSANAAINKLSLNVSQYEEHFSFNFSYLTKDDEYNFNYYKEKTKVGEFAKRLFNTIENISSI